MNGQKYEKRVASYLRSKGYRGVTITKTSGDYGVDIVANKMFHKYAVQCKYYAKPVGISAVQQVVAGMKYYECDRAIVVTNSTFTRQAKQLAEHNDVILIEKVSPYNSVLTEWLLRLASVGALFCLYKMGYVLTVILIVIIALILFGLGLYLRFNNSKDSNSNISDDTSSN